MTGRHINALQTHCLHLLSSITHRIVFQLFELSWRRVSASQRGRKQVERRACRGVLITMNATVKIYVCLLIVFVASCRITPCSGKRTTKDWGKVSSPILQAKHACIHRSVNGQHLFCVFVELLRCTACTTECCCLCPLSVSTSCCCFSHVWHKIHVSLLLDQFCSHKTEVCPTCFAVVGYRMTFRVIKIRWKHKALSHDIMCTSFK